MAIVKKITTGFVTQRFDTDTGKCLDQEFTCSDEVVCENEDGETVDEPDYLKYQPYHMSVKHPVGLVITKEQALSILRKPTMIRNLEEGMRGDIDDPLGGMSSRLHVDEAEAVLMWQDWALKDPEPRMGIGPEKSIELWSANLT